MLPMMRVGEWKGMDLMVVLTSTLIVYVCASAFAGNRCWKDSTSRIFA